jgi:hypothetical protein
VYHWGQVFDQEGKCVVDPPLVENVQVVQDED